MTIRLTSKAVAAGAILFLGIALALATTIDHGTGAAPANPPGLIQNVLAQKTLITPRELARWIIEKKQDYQLIDLRAPWEFDDFHIPTATNVPLETLLELRDISTVSRSKRIVLYGRGAGRAAQAQILLAQKGYNAYSLRGGIAAWWKDVMTPRSLGTENLSPSGYLQAKQLRNYFMGNSSSKTFGGQATPASTPATIPPPATKKKVPATKLKLGRGCS